MAHRRCGGGLVSRGQVSWLPDRPPVDPSRALRPVVASTFVPGYSGGGRAGISPASLGRGSWQAPWPAAGSNSTRRSARSIAIGGGRLPDPQRLATMSPRRGEVPVRIAVSRRIDDSTSELRSPRRHGTSSEKSPAVGSRNGRQRSLRDPAEPWQGRDGRGVPRLRSQHPAAGGAQGRARGVAHARRRRGAPAGAPARALGQPPQRVPRARSRAQRLGPDPGDGADRRADAAHAYPQAQGPGRVHGGRVPQDRQRDGGGPRGHPRPGSGPR